MLISAGCSYSAGVGKVGTDGRLFFFASWGGVIGGVKGAISGGGVLRDGYTLDIVCENEGGRANVSEDDDEGAVGCRREEVGKRKRRGVREGR